MTQQMSSVFDCLGPWEGAAQHGQHQSVMLLLLPGLGQCVHSESCCGLILTGEDPSIPHGGQL